MRLLVDKEKKPSICNARLRRRNGRSALKLFWADSRQDGKLLFGMLITVADFRCGVLQRNARRAAQHDGGSFEDGCHVGDQVNEWMKPKS
jgi:hypothetical protein